MSGHSKWHNIQGRKSVQDQKRGKIFTQLAKNITIAVRKTGIANPDDNPVLRAAVDKAREANMPHENVKRAIDRGLGKGTGGAALEEVIYEGYGPGGIGVLAIVRTDNKQRTAAEIRYLFDRSGGSLGGPGSVMYLFTRSGAEYVPTITFPVAPDAREAVREFLDSLEEHDDVESVYTNAVLE